MSNNLLFKVQPTLSIDSVETDLNNYEISKSYTTYNETTAVLAGTTGAATSLSLTSPASLPATATFIELQSDQELSFLFNNTTGATVTTLTNVKYLAGEYVAHTMSIENANTDDANIKWRIYTT